MQRRTFLALAALAARARANTRGMQLTLSPGALGIRGSIREVVDLAAKHGFDAVEATGLNNMSDGQLEELLGYMKSKNIRFGFGGSPVDFRGEEGLFKDGMAKLPAQAKVLQKVGVTRATTWFMPRSQTLTYLQNFKLHAVRLREIGKALGDNGLNFGLEYVAPKTIWATQRYTFARTLAETRELIAEIGLSNVGLVLDSWHWYHAGDTPADLLQLKSKDVVSVDLNDAPSGVPKDEMVDGKRELPASTGVIDVKGFLGSLEKIGYDGPVRVEPFNQAVREMTPDAAAAAAMSGLKKAFAS